MKNIRWKVAKVFECLTGSHLFLITDVVGNILVNNNEFDVNTDICLPVSLSFSQKHKSQYLFQGR